MATQREAPPRQWLVKAIAKGMTNAEMAQAWNTEVGYEAANENSVKQARYRDGLTGSSRARYSEEIPWKMKREHSMHPLVRNLRLLAKAKRGEELDRANQGRLAAFLKNMGDNKVVTYNRDTEQGFFVVERRPEDGDGMIRRPW